MTLATVVHLTVCSTDVDAIVANVDALTGRLAEADVKPAQTLWDGARPAFPDLMAELEGTAVA